MAFAVPAQADLCRGPFSRADKVAREILQSAGIEVGETSKNGMQIHDPSFGKRFLSDPPLAFGETYMEGLWTGDIYELTRLLIKAVQEKGVTGLAKPLWQTPILAARALINENYRNTRDRFTNRQSRQRSTRVAKEHYDLGLDLYRGMLDPTMTYTSGLWAEGYDLEDAQNAKYDLLARKLGLTPGQHILDIGSGYGGFARFAARHYGVKVTGISISVEQLKAARELSKNVAGVEFMYMDYRDIPHYFAPGTFDHVISIEMIEAVGHKNLAEYFRAAHFALKEGGRFALQAFAAPTDRVNANAWFSKYIFHDGLVPSRGQVDRAAQPSFGSPVDQQDITENYIPTLLTWQRNFDQAWANLPRDRYDDRFRRMWDFYLLSIAAGFSVRAPQLDQIVYVKGKSQTPITPVRDLPSRARLDEFKTPEAQKKADTQNLLELEAKRRVIQATIQNAKKPTQIHIPNLNERICVVGAGPAGLMAAQTLKKLGYKNVVVYEAAPAVGGKSHTVEIDGRRHDLGATMGVSVKYKIIQTLAEEAGQETIPFPEPAYYDLSTGRQSPKPTRLEQANLAFQGLRYLMYHSRIARRGERGLDIPDDELADPWPVVMSRQNFGVFADKMQTYTTGYGYDGGKDTPAVFAARMMDTRALVGAAVGKAIMWKNGTQLIWQHLASELNVRTDHRVERIERDAFGVTLHIEGAPAPENFDRLILAVDPGVALNVLDATSEETSLFSQVRYTPYATFAVRVEGLANGRAEVGHLKENMSLDRPGHPMVWVKRYPDDNLFVVHLFAPENLSDDQVMAHIDADLKRLGATRTTYVTSRRWRFFPHVSSEAMREGHWYSRAWALQGQNRTYFANEAYNMSTMPDSAALGQKVAHQMARGHH